MSVVQTFVHRNKDYFSTLFALLGFSAALLLFTAKGEVLLWIANQRTTAGDFLFRFITMLGEGYAYVALALVALWIRFRYTLAIAGAGISAITTSAILKFMFNQPRPKTYFAEILQKPHLVSYVPDVQLNESWTNSFPSGHTIGAFALYGLIAFMSPSRPIKILCLFIAASVGFSRMYLFQHFLADVTVGAMIGTCIAAGMYALQNYWKYHRAALNDSLPIAF